MDFSSSVMEQTFTKRPNNTWHHHSKVSPAIMKSIDNISLILPNRDISDFRNSNNFHLLPPDVTLTSGSDFQSLKLLPSLDGHSMPSSFLLLDKEEVLQVSLHSFHMSAHNL